MKTKHGFTLAEVLLTLAVIGIVAAITLPSLLVDTTEKAFDAQKRALHARLAQAIGMMSSLSGYGQYVTETKEGAGDGKDNAAETFLYEGLSKVYKINNICDSDNLDKCGIPSSITTMAGTTMNFPKKLSELSDQIIFTGKDQSENDIPHGASDISITDTKVAAFETVNGESIAVFYNPNCKNNQESGTVNEDWGDYYYMSNKICANFIYDLNGLKGPNKVGRDIGFITALYAKNSEVAAPIPFETDVEGGYIQKDAVEACANYADDSRLPNKDELTSLWYNAYLIGNLKMGWAYWSSTVLSPTEARAQGIMPGGHRTRSPRTHSQHVRCVRK